ncbi:MAG: UDP-N-acetylmuramate dehydrogenase [Anaerolineales bacterium]|nr:UDP-N-acetylmuramate dehydrogenase [Anaerolineales bacterium]
MIQTDMRPADWQILQDAFGDRLEMGASLARYSAARLGGPADALLAARSSQELARVAELCWQRRLPFVILGGGSNVLISDAGVRGLVVLNRARRMRFDESADPPTVWAESGASFGNLARRAAQRGLAGLEWAAGIPGTLGGAVVGNAGAHGADMAGSLVLAEILHRKNTGQSDGHRREMWPVERLEYSYRSSILKGQPGQAVVLAAILRLERSTPQSVQLKMDEIAAYRRKTQPRGASMGSMFKNPPGDYAGRLIEAAGLKGARVGDAQISSQHANFFLNLGQATAMDIYELIQLARQAVAEKFAVELELEIELLGEW